MTGAAAKAD